MQNLTISPNNIHLFAYTNEKCLSGPVRGVVVNFHGLGHRDMKYEPDGFDLLFAEHNILTIFPYYGPWIWMNNQAISYVDQVMAAVKVRHNLANNIPWVSSGGSMGGLSALVYARYAAVPPVACAVNCPVCDLPYHATERDDLPRTMLVSFSHYPKGVEAGMKRHSPVHIAAQLPKVPYLVVHGDADIAVNKAAHSDKLVSLMQNHDVEYIEVPGMAHCDLHAAPDALRRYQDFIIYHATSYGG